jgi:hypothetical protein
MWRQLTHNKWLNYDPDELLKTKGQNKKDVKNEGSSG